MKVWVADTERFAPRFHKSLECKRTGRGEYTQVDLQSLEGPVPCATCYPTAPRFTGRYRKCQEGCVGACKHTGVLVIDRRHPVQMVWKWPHAASRYEIVDYVVAKSTRQG